MKKHSRVVLQFSSVVCWTFCLFLLICVNGCGRTKSVDSGSGGEKSPIAPKRSPLTVVRELARGTVDAGTSQEILNLVQTHLLENSKAKEEFAALPLDEELLQERFNLADDEIEFLRGVSFKGVDAFYLEWCFHLRDAAEALGMSTMTPLQRAKQAFQWTQRHVVLNDDSADELLPAAMVVKMGSGTAQERALVFVDLLRQVGLEGCIIAYPDKKSDEPHYWLAGALIGDKIYLFEPRLGVAVPKADGAGVATLEDLRAHPELLNQFDAGKDYSYDVSERQAAKAEVHLVGSLSALSPRMTYLEKQLQTISPIQLAIDPKVWVDEWEKAAGGKVHIWNAAADSEEETGPTSPWRAARLLLPPGLGGLGGPQRLESLQSRLVYRSSIDARLEELNITAGQFPPEALQRLHTLVNQLFALYTVAPRENLTRGRLENMLSPLKRIDNVMTEFDRNDDKSAVANDIENWRKAIEKIYSDDSPRSKNLQHLIWHQDPYLREVLVPGKEDQDIPKSIKRKILTFIILYGCADAINKETGYLLASYWREKAQQAQNEVERLAKSGSPVPQGRRRQAEMNWSNALQWIERYLNRYGVASQPAALGKQLQQMRQQWVSTPWERRLSIPEDFFKAVHRSLAMRLLYVDTLIQLGDVEKARAVGKKLVADAAALRKSEELEDLLDEFEESLDEANLRREDEKFLRRRLRRLASTLDEYGSIYWIGYSARLRSAGDKPA